MDLSRFEALFAAPQSGTSLAPSDMGLADSPAFAGADLMRCTGLFREGLLSVCSPRENGGALDAWGRYLPPGARLLASSAFGFLFVACGPGLWVVDPQAGQVVESDVPLAELFDLLCDPDLREDFLRESLFDDWRKLSDEPLVQHWLCPSPAIALGGNWSLASLVRMPTGPFLSFTAGLFEAEGPNAVEIRRLVPA